MTLADGRLFHRLPPRVDRVAQAHATEAVLAERIAELWRFRAWYRRQPRWDIWMDLAERNDVELRALVAIARRARRLAAAELIPYRDVWTESELRFAAGDR